MRKGLVFSLSAPPLYKPYFFMFKLLKKHPLAKLSLIKSKKGIKAGSFLKKMLMPHTMITPKALTGEGLLSRVGSMIKKPSML